MIYLYSGLPGSGKSYHVAKDILRGRLRRSSFYMCNFPVSVDGVAELPSLDLTVDDALRARQAWLDEGHTITREGQIKLIIDECQLVFNSRDWNSPSRRDWLSFFTQHRKLGFDVILIAQDISMLDKQIRSVIEIDCHHYKLNNFGLAGSLLSLATLGHPVCHATYIVNGLRRANAGRVGHEFFFVHKGVYRVYDSHSLFGSALADKVEAHGATAPSGADLPASTAP